MAAAGRRNWRWHCLPTTWATTDEALDFHHRFKWAVVEKLPGRGIGR